MKRYIGKYATGARQCDEQIAAQARRVAALPLATRKLIKQRDAALVAYNTAIIDGAAHETIATLGSEYRRLKDAVNNA